MALSVHRPRVRAGTDRASGNQPYGAGRRMLTERS